MRVHVNTRESMIVAKQHTSTQSALKLVPTAGRRNNMENTNQKKRKVNFTDGEIRKLIELYSEHKDILTARLNNTNTNRHKLSAWKTITASINNCDGGLRTVEEVRKKWKDLLSRAKKDSSILKNPPTGGGPLPKISPYSAIIIELFGEDSPTFTGLNGIDSTEMSAAVDVCESDRCSTDDGVTAVSCCQSDSADLPTQEGSPTVCLTTHTETQEGSQHQSAAPLPKRSKKDLAELQRILVEKEILRVEAETAKLKAEHEKLELEKTKLRLEIKLLERQENRHNFSEDSLSFTIL